MEYAFRTVDVFTEQRFGGNQLAVIADATGLTDLQMQQIAIEFNYSETTFVLPPAAAENTCEVRIFTPAGELPFAGHPNVGTAHVLADEGRLGAADAPVLNARFEEKAGLVDIAVTFADAAATVEVRAPRGLDRHAPCDRGVGAALLGLDVSELGPLQPCYAESGVGFMLVEVADAEVLARSAAAPEVLGQHQPDARTTGVYAFTRHGTSVGHDVRARMFAPLQGIAEDPATGSAACVLAAVLAAERGEDGIHRFAIEQGIEMGRPSQLSAQAAIAEAQVDAIHLYGRCVDVMRGVLQI
ncbi:MAG: PhzF family phenazine biosynthesis protein [Pseudomonadota bacterium]